MNARRFLLLAVICLAAFGPSRPVQAEENGPSDNMMSIYGMLGASAGRQDRNYGIIKGNGLGGGFGVMAALVFPFATLPGGDLKVGVYGGGDVMAGSGHTSTESGSILGGSVRGEGGFQLNVPLKWQSLRTSVRAGGIFLGDTWAGGVYGKSLKVRVDWRQYSAELGFAVSPRGGSDPVDASNAQSLTLRWRESFLKCFGVGVERLSVPDTQSDGFLARVFYSVDM